ncbi:MAG TPA: hypothetical protein VJ673_16885 [Aromatoleum sp.]|uniref:hypothetical protein n=1 Tax=Aromatoleum sp. TaxID=2307007 RepID=UPI002B459018|nr:hypothetical protein [Aromatoleum sp.]HJV27366.1 hypothetical protein [Aromatoleum sp.]
MFSLYRSMRPVFHLALLLAAGFLTGLPPATAAAEAPAVDIRVEGDGWGTASREEIEGLLYSVAEQLLNSSAASLNRPIVVTHESGSPVTLFKKGGSGEYRVQLSATNRGWAQYAYQFGHEFCHIMSNYDVRGDDPARRENQWFEEALCEAAGVHALRSMAERWEVEAPFPSWEAYAPRLRSYADRLVSEPHRQLPPGVSPQGWLQTQLPVMSHNPYLRDDNEVVANLLLPLFEQSRDNWSALRYLNLAPAGAGTDLAEYVRQWRRSAPAEHRLFIDSVAQLLGVPAETGVGVAARVPSSSAF